MISTLCADILITITSLLPLSALEKLAVSCKWFRHFVRSTKDYKQKCRVFNKYNELLTDAIFVKSINDSAHKHITEMKSLIIVFGDAKLLRYTIETAFWYDCHGFAPTCSLKWLFSNIIKHGNDELFDTFVDAYKGKYKNFERISNKDPREFPKEYTGPEGCTWTPLQEGLGAAAQKRLTNTFDILFSMMDLNVESTVYIPRIFKIAQQNDDMYIMDKLLSVNLSIMDIEDCFEFAMQSTSVGLMKSIYQRLPSPEAFKNGFRDSFRLVRRGCTREAVDFLVSVGTSPDHLLQAYVSRCSNMKRHELDYIISKVDTEISWQKLLSMLHGNAVLNLGGGREEVYRLCFENGAVFTQELVLWLATTEGDFLPADIL